MHTVLRICGLFLVLVSVFGTHPHDTLAQSHLTDEARLIAQNVVGETILVDRYAVWIDGRDGPDARTIRAYNLDSAQEFVIASVGSNITELVGDEHTVAWKLLDSNRVERYDLRTQQGSVLVDIEQAGDLFLITLEDEQLYYLCRRTNDGQNCENAGIYAYDITAETTRRVLDLGMLPVIADDTAVWIEQTGVDFGFYTQNLAEPTAQPRQLGSGAPCFHDVGSGHIAWCMSRTLFLTTITDTTTLTITTGQSTWLAHPVVDANTVAWSGSDRTLHTYDISSTRSGTIVAEAAYQPVAQAVSDQQELIFTLPVTSTVGIGSNLYVTSLATRNLRFPGGQASATVLYLPILSR